MRYLIIVFFGFFITNTSFAEDTTVDMLNKLDKRSMLYSQEIVRISAGDTVFWKATNNMEIFKIKFFRQAIRSRRFITSHVFNGCINFRLC